MDSDVPEKLGPALEEADDVKVDIKRALSWDEARSCVQRELGEYLKSDLPVSHGNLYQQGDKPSWFSWWFRHNLDFYAASLPASLALLVLSCVSYNAGKDDNNASGLNARADLDVYKSQLAGAVIFLSGTLFSIILMLRRSETCKKDSDVSKRHTISRFLLAMKKTNEDHVERSLHSHLRSTRGQSSDADTIPLSGTSLTGIYPTYRRKASEAAAEGAWHRVPTLLLARGDYIALQIGDIAPAPCTMVKTRSGGKPTTPVTVAAGERLMLESLGNEVKTALSSLPRGKSTLSSGRDLLTLCNNMSVFVVQETPLGNFLSLPPVDHKPPQLHRQIKDIRAVLFFVATVVFVLTFVLIFVRPRVLERDLSILLPLPFLAALGVLPVTTPVCAFFLEVFGTSRILLAVHPHASMRSYFRDESVGDKQADMILFVRYCLATASSRLSLEVPERYLRNGLRRFSRGSPEDMAENTTSHDIGRLSSGLIHVPPASVYLLEKLGVATAFSLVDDELACEPHSSPQQLLIPSGKGLKLLDLCRFSEDEFEDESDSDKNPTPGDSDSDEEQQYQHTTLRRRKMKALRLGNIMKVSRMLSDVSSSSQNECSPTDENDVQFEDPQWWQHLPSLKCIGLACLLVDDPHRSKSNTPLYRGESSRSLKGEQLAEGTSHHSHSDQSLRSVSRASSTGPKRSFVTFATVSSCEEESIGLRQEIREVENSLSDHICSERSRSQLRSLARCIGFSGEVNTFGHRGDLTSFRELMRLHVISTRLLNERFATDAHALGLEESRSWGELRPDSTSVIIQDHRSKGYQLLTVGHPRVIAELCQEAWQGENSTIFPLSSKDKSSILDTSSNWSLADLDVAAFCYAPVPHTLDQRVGKLTKRHTKEKTLYLIDNPVPKESTNGMSDDWALIKNQIFLGVLGSSVVPRKEIEPLIEAFNDAGVRFVYFSPRNMRRTKELASGVGIDVAWNCAISLRPLDEGEDDKYRMTSTYADWDVNAKLPHGIEAVRRHLEEVDNVPLLVSLFTDVTKETTMEMVKTFQEYSDTVLAMGLSHLRRNAGIFAASDLAVGVDILTELADKDPLASRSRGMHSFHSVLPCEITFVSTIAAHSCVFNLLGASATSLMPSIIERARAALDATTSAAMFVLSGCFSFSMYVLFCTCSFSTTINYVPALGSVLYLQVTLPLIGLALAMTEPDKESMSRVPPKNDQAVTFARNEGKRLYTNAFLKALAPAVLTQVLYYIAFGELMIEFEPELVASLCLDDGDELENLGWISLVRCDGLREYSGGARISAGALILSELVLCVVLASSSFVYRAIPIWREPPWRRNHAWVFSVVIAIILVAVYLALSLEDGTFAALPWYFYFLAVIIPFICIVCAEAVKALDDKHEKRAVTLRRLQFETRLGMWSPK